MPHGVTNVPTAHPLFIPKHFTCVIVMMDERSRDNPTTFWRVSVKMPLQMPTFATQITYYAK